MYIQIHSSQGPDVAATIPDVVVPASDSAEVARWLELNQHVEFKLHPEAIIHSIHRARQRGCTSSHLGAMLGLAERARDLGHLVDWRRRTTSGTSFMVLQVSPFEIDEPSTIWSANSAQVVFYDIGIPYSPVGEIQPDVLVSKCDEVLDQALSRDTVWSGRIRILRRIAEWARVRGRHVAWC